MKIKYTFVTGENTEVEVNEEIGTIILDSRRIEINADRKERYHCYSLETEWEKENTSTILTPETEFLLKLDNEKLYIALSKLSEIQKRRLLMLSEGFSIRKIAEIENANYRSVYDSIEQARKKIKKFL